MNILFLITSLGGGGAERVVCNLSNYLVAQNNEVSIIVLRGSDAKYEIDENVKIEYLQKDYYDSTHSVLDRIMEYRLVKKRLTKLDSHECLVTFLELPMALSLVLRKKIASSLIVCERNYPEAYRSYYTQIFKMYIKRADGCLFQTEDIRDWYRPFYGDGKKTSVIPNSLDPKFIDAPYAKRDNKRFIAVGRLDKQKNHELLIRAFSGLAECYPDYTLDICGTGPLEDELSKLIKELRIDNQVRLIGYKKDILQELINSSYFILSSDYEGMPNVLMEAMAVGLPCIATDCKGGGARSLITDGQNGILVPCGDVDAMIQAMKKVIVDPDYSSKLAMNALMVKERFSPNKINEEWSLFINSFNESSLRNQ